MKAARSRAGRSKRRLYTESGLRRRIISAGLQDFSHSVDEARFFRFFAIGISSMRPPA
jgi:hypothetical protein